MARERSLQKCFMMTERTLCFALFGNEFNHRMADALRQMMHVMRAHGARVLVDPAFLGAMQQLLPEETSLQPLANMTEQHIDFAISMGGDGTLLRTAGKVAFVETPIIGVNMGRLGFLANVQPEELDDVLTSIEDGSYELVDHSAIVLSIEGDTLEECPVALNDIAVLKRDHASMITIRAMVDGKYLTTYQADGLVISTPTGSTAYNLSNGGPIAMPDSHVLCLTPVAPHSLNMRPVVISDTSEITLTVESRTHNFLAAIDGRSVKLDEHVRLTVSKAPFNIHIVKHHAHDYYSTLREKLMWGADQREQ